MCCHHPVLAEERARKRGELLSATEKELENIAAATRREKRPLRGKDKIALRVGKVINHYKMAKHFTLEITEDSFSFTRNQDGIAAEAALDGIYVLRTSLPKDTLTESDVVARYKNLADVERFFRTLNSELDARPIPASAGRTGPCPHVLADVVLDYLSWHMKQALAPILFQDNDKPAAAAKRANPVAAAQRSDQALRKAARKHTGEFSARLFRYFDCRFHRGHHHAVGGPVAGELIGHQHTRHIPQSLEQFAEELSGCFRVSA